MGWRCRLELLRAVCITCALCSLLFARQAFAEQLEAVVLPTALEVDPSKEPDESLVRMARDLDIILGEAVQDLGLTLDVSERPADDRQTPSEEALIERATKTWVVSARLEALDNNLVLRVVAVPPGSNVVLSRSEKIEPRALEVRASVMLRDVIRVAKGAPRDAKQDPAPEPAAEIPAGPASSGRAVLALNAAVLGGYVGYSLQRASGSGDERLTYPLIALGAGLGLGASMLVADEWNVTLADAWYLSAGTWWPTAAGLLVAESYDVKDEDQFVYGLAAAGGGVALSAAALSLGPITEGDAVLTHSGGVFGLLLGGVTELAYEGVTDITPYRGAGFGTGIGVIAAGALATQIDVSSSRMLFIDLSASLGMLVGAAAASPLLFVEEDQTKPRTRAWLASVTAGMLIGGGLGVFWTREKAAPTTATASAFRYLPYANVSPKKAPNGDSATGFDFGVQGTW